MPPSSPARCPKRRKNKVADFSHEFSYFFFMRVGVVSSPREARLWNYFAKGDEFFTIREWPAYLQEMMLLDHKNNRERFSLFFFLTGNGLNPTLAADWIQSRDVRGGQHLVTGVYDPQAIRHFAQLIEQSRTGTLFKGDKKMMDMTMGHVVTM